MPRTRRVPWVLLVLVVIAALAAPAARAVTLGPGALNVATTGYGGAAIYTNDGFGSTEVPADGTVTSWAANFECGAAGAGCGARLTVVREAAGWPSPWFHFQTVAASALAAPSGSGVRGFSTKLRVRAGDRLAIAPVGSTGIYDANTGNFSDLMRYARDDTMLSFSSWIPTRYMLFNADFTPSAPSTTTVVATQAAPGEPIGYVAQVARQGGGGGGPVSSGTVAFREQGAAVPGCQAVPVVAGEATCSAAAHGGGARAIAADYTGDIEYGDSSGTTSVGVVAGTATTVGVAGGAPLARGGSATYRAVVSPAPDAGVVAFTLDGAAIAGCAARPVDPATGVATCAAAAPATRGHHEVVAAFGGAASFLASTAVAANVAMGAPVLAAPASVELGTVAVGATATKMVSLGNAGSDALAVSSVGLTGDDAFAIAEDGCGAAAAALAIGATCAIRVTFTPRAPGAATAVLTVAGDDGAAPHAIALRGVGERRPAATTTPATPRESTPAAVAVPGVPALVGAILARPPGATLPVNARRALTLPLACPATTACAVTGTLTTSTLGRTSTTLARLGPLRLPGGTRRAITLRLPAAALAAAHRRHLSRLRTTLVLRTTLASAATPVVTRTTLTLALRR
jgi:Bacterial Ig-like domain (group 3)/Abnormal spindle-like microcephaly-assoc'd, ASPM-SPD-2-Hydin